ncbi:MAG: hypothetical protein H0W50_08705 [Parachlamydiaceae bacterium]|nr:hypothetical protein [Parachlamydiaceae bacterium]
MLTLEKDEKFTNPFYVKDCVLAPLATGIKAQTLAEFRDCLKIIPVECIYYHFWRQSIETSLIQGSFFNDFSNWVHYSLHDDILAERLAVIDPSYNENLEDLRLDLLDVVEDKIIEEEMSTQLYATETFHFIKSNIIIFNTSYKMEHPKDLVKIIPAISRSSIFYHFIDARRREVIKLDDFSKWLRGFNNEFDTLVDRFKQIDPYFTSLSDLQKKLSLEVSKYFFENCEVKGDFHE